MAVRSQTKLAHPLAAARANLRVRRQRTLGQAISSLQTAFIGRDIAPAQALQYAKIVLSRPGVRITENGIRFNGKLFSPEAFATSHLADVVTGVAANRRNEAAITGSPLYMQAAAQLGYQRQSVFDAATEQRRRALLDYGDPSLLANDPQMAAAAAANPFSLTAGLARQQAAEALATRQTASQVGTLYGGGYVSGQQEAQRQDALRRSNAVTALQDMLTGLGRQQTSAETEYQLGLDQARQQASDQLIQSGWHAAVAPTFHVGTYAYGQGLRRPTLATVGRRLHLPKPGTPVPNDFPGVNKRRRTRIGGFV